MHFTDRIAFGQVVVPDREEIRCHAIECDTYRFPPIRNIPAALQGRRYGFHRWCLKRVCNGIRIPEGQRLGVANRFIQPAAELLRAMSCFSLMYEA